MALIYKVTNKQNGKFYIGRTCGTLTRRINQHIWYARHKTADMPFVNALRKYGRGGFDWEVLEECSREESGDREVFYISQMNPLYNVTAGGDGGRYGIPCPEHVKEATRQSRIVKVRDKRTGRVYNSMKEAREVTGVSESSISRSVKYKGGNWERIS